MVRTKASVRCLSVSLSCLSCLVLSLTLVYCGQTVRWIKMKLGMQVGLGPGHIVSDGELPPPSPKGHSPQFSAHICCGQMAKWIKMLLGMEVGLDPGDFVLDGDPAPPSAKRRQSPQIFGPCLLWPNGWMDQDGTWYRDRPQPRRLCVRGTQPPRQKALAPPRQFSAHFYRGQTAGCIKMLFGVDVGLSPGNFVLVGDLAP